MISSQDKYFAGLITGEQYLTRDQLPCSLGEGVVAIAKQVDPDFTEEFRHIEHRAAAAELAHHRVVTHLLSALGEAGIDCVVIKGTALAYLVYEQPWHRSRSDTDLLIREQDIDAAISILEQQQLEQQVSLPGRLAFGECAFEKTDEFGLSHTIDLHWRFNNNWLLANTVKFDELWEERIPVELLGTHGWTCSNPAALLLACVHRCAHLGEVAYEEDGFLRYQSDFSLWVYDIHLLSESLDEVQWVEWCDRVIDKRAAEMALSGLERSQALFQTRIPTFVINTLRRSKGQINPARLQGRLAGEWQSFWAVDHRLKARFLIQQLVPEAGYMRDRYGDQPLLLGYVKRLLGGLSRRAG